MIIFQASGVEEAFKSLMISFLELPEENLPQTRDILDVVKLVAYLESYQITAWGMFPVKKGLFLTLVGTLATYGALLVQFT